MNTKGHFRITRDIFEKNIFKNIIDFRLFFLILGQAMFTDNVEIAGENLQRGEWLRSYRQLQKDLAYYEKKTLIEYGIGTIKRSVDRLAAEHLIEIREPSCGTLTRTTGTIFKVNDYNRWQDVGELPNRQKEQGAEQGAEHIPPEVRNNNNNDFKNKNDINNKPLPPARARRINFSETYFMAYGAHITPIQLQTFNAYIDQDGIEEAAVCLAIEKAASSSGNFGYLKGILNSWIHKGIRTLDQAQMDIESGRKSINGTSRANPGPGTKAAASGKKTTYQGIEFDW